jgi:hypothetical protein
MQPTSTPSLHRRDAVGIVFENCDDFSHVGMLPWPRSSIAQMKHTDPKNRHPLKFTIDRHGVWYPLPFAVCMFAMGVGMTGWFIYLFISAFRELRILIPIGIYAFFSYLSFGDVRRHLRSLQSQRRLAAGRCRSCGYSLCGNVSGSCPEWGTPCVEN